MAAKVHVFIYLFMNGSIHTACTVKCFDVRFGWFEVLFLGEQVLYGTYGGSEGKMALPDRGALT